MVNEALHTNQEIELNTSRSSTFCLSSAGLLTLRRFGDSFRQVTQPLHHQHTNIDTTNIDATNIDATDIDTPPTIDLH